MGKGAGDQCRGAMTLDAARAPQPAALPEPDRFAAIFTGFQHERSGLEARLKDAEAYTGFEYDDRVDRFVADGVTVVCGIHDQRTGHQVGSFARRCWIDSSGRLAVRHSNVFIDNQSRARAGFGTALVQHAIPQYRALGAHRLEVGATGLGSWAWSRFPFHFRPPDGMTFDQAAADPRRASALGGQEFFAEVCYRLEQLVAAGKLPAGEADIYAQQLPTEDDVHAGRLEGMICTPGELRGLGRDGTRFEDVRNDRVRYRIDSWAGRYALSHGTWEGVIYLQS